MEMPMSTPVDFNENRTGLLLQMCSREEFQTRVADKDVALYERNERGEPDFSRAVKKYPRSAAGTEATPSMIRPDHILLQTMDYLLSKIIVDVELPYHNIDVFCADRFRGIRSDYQYQEVFTIGRAIALEVQIRYSILSSYLLMDQEYEHAQLKLNANAIRNALEKLLSLYSSGITTGNEAEFFSYNYLFYNDPTALRSIPSQYYDTPIFRATLHLFHCYETMNYTLLYKFLLSPDSPLLLSCFFVSQHLAQFNINVIDSFYLATRTTNGTLEQITQDLITSIQQRLHLRKADVVQYLLSIDKNPVRRGETVDSTIIELFGLNPWKNVLIRLVAGKAITDPKREKINLPPRPTARRVYSLDHRIIALTPVFLLSHNYFYKDAVFTPILRYNLANKFPRHINECFPRLFKLFHPNGVGGLGNSHPKEILHYLQSIFGSHSPSAAQKHQQYLQNWMNLVENKWYINLPDVQPLVMPPGYQVDDVVIGIYQGDPASLWKPRVISSSSSKLNSFTIPVRPPMANNVFGQVNTTSGNGGSSIPPPPPPTNKSLTINKTTLNSLTAHMTNPPKSITTGADSAASTASKMTHLSAKSAPFTMPTIPSTEPKTIPKVDIVTKSITTKQSTTNTATTTPGPGAKLSSTTASLHSLAAPTTQQLSLATMAPATPMTQATTLNRASLSSVNYSLPGLVLSYDDLIAPFMDKSLTSELKNTPQQPIMQVNNPFVFAPSTSTQPKTQSTGTIRTITALKSSSLTKLSQCPVLKSNGYGMGSPNGTISTQQNQPNQSNVLEKLLKLYQSRIHSTSTPIPPFPPNGKQPLSQDTNAGKKAGLSDLEHKRAVEGILGVIEGRFLTILIKSRRLISLSYLSYSLRQKRELDEANQMIEKKHKEEMELKRQQDGIVDIVKEIDAKLLNVQISENLTKLAETLRQRSLLKKLSLQLFILPWLSRWRENTEKSLQEKELKAERQARWEFIQTKLNLQNNNTVKRMLLQQYGGHLSIDNEDDGHYDDDGNLNTYDPEHDDRNTEDDDEDELTPQWALQFKKDHDNRVKQGESTPINQYNQLDTFNTTKSTSLDEIDDELPSYEDFQMFARAQQELTGDHHYYHNNDEDQDVDRRFHSDDSDNEHEVGYSNLHNLMHNFDTFTSDGDSKDERGYERGYYGDDTEAHETSDVAVDTDSDYGHEGYNNSRHTTNTTPSQSYTTIVPYSASDRKSGQAFHPLYTKSYLISMSDRSKFHQQLDLIKNFLHLQYLFTTPLSHFSFINAQPLISTILIGYLLQFRRVLYHFSQRRFLHFFKILVGMDDTITTSTLPLLQSLISNRDDTHNTIINNSMASANGSYYYNGNNTKMPVSNHHSNTIVSNGNNQFFDQRNNYDKQDTKLSRLPINPPDLVDLQDFLMQYGPRQGLFPSTIFPIHIITATFNQNNLQLYLDSLQTDTPGVVSIKDLKKKDFTEDKKMHENDDNLTFDNIELNDRGTHVQFDEGSLQLLLATSSSLGLSLQYAQIAQKSMTKITHNSQDLNQTDQFNEETNVELDNFVNSTQLYQYSFAINPADDNDNGSNYDEWGNELSSNNDNIYPLVEFQPVSSTFSESGKAHNTQHKRQSSSQNPTLSKNSTQNDKDVSLDDTSFIEILNNTTSDPFYGINEKNKDNKLSMLKNMISSTIPSTITTLHAPIDNYDILESLYGEFELRNGQEIDFTQNHYDDGDDDDDYNNSGYSTPNQHHNSNNQQQNNDNYDNQNDTTHYIQQNCRLSLGDTDIFIPHATYDTLIAQLPRLTAGFRGQASGEHDQNDLITQTDNSFNISKSFNHQLTPSSVALQRAPTPLCCFNTRLSYDQLVIKGINIVPLSISLTTTYLNKVYQAVKQYNTAVRHLYSVSYLEQLVSYERKVLKLLQQKSKNTNDVFSSAFQPHLGADHYDATSPPQFIMTSSLEAQLAHLQRGFVEFLDAWTMSLFGSILPILDSLKMIIKSVQTQLFQDQVTELTLQHRQQVRMEWFNQQVRSIEGKIKRYNELKMLLEEKEVKIIRLAGEEKKDDKEQTNTHTSLSTSHHNYQKFNNTNENGNQGNDNDINEHDEVTLNELSDSKHLFEFQLLSHEIRTIIRDTTQMLNLPIKSILAPISPNQSSVLHDIDVESDGPLIDMSGYQNNRNQNDDNDLNTSIFSYNSTLSESPVDITSTLDYISPETAQIIEGMALENVKHESPRLLFMITLNPHTALWLEQFNDHYLDANLKHSTQFTSHQTLGTLPFGTPGWGTVGVISSGNQGGNNGTKNNTNTLSSSSSTIPGTETFFSSPSSPSRSKSKNNNDPLHLHNQPLSQLTHVEINGLLSTRSKIALVSLPMVDICVEPTLGKIFDIVQSSAYRVFWSKDDEKDKMNDETTSSQQQQHYSDDILIKNFDDECIVLCTNTFESLTKSTPPTNSSHHNDNKDIVEPEPYETAGKMGVGEKLTQAFSYIYQTLEPTLVFPSLQLPNTLDIGDILNESKSSSSVTQFGIEDNVCEYHNDQNTRQMGHNRQNGTAYSSNQYSTELHNMSFNHNQSVLNIDVNVHDVNHDDNNNKSDQTEYTTPNQSSQFTSNSNAYHNNPSTNNGLDRSFESSIFSASSPNSVNIDNSIMSGYYSHNSPHVNHNNTLYPTHRYPQYDVMNHDKTDNGYGIIDNSIVNNVPSLDLTTTIIPINTTFVPLSESKYGYNSNSNDIFQSNTKNIKTKHMSEDERALWEAKQSLEALLQQSETISSEFHPIHDTTTVNPSGINGNGFLDRSLLSDFIHFPHYEKISSTHNVNNLSTSNTTTVSDDNDPLSAHSQDNGNFSILYNTNPHLAVGEYALKSKQNPK